MLRKGDSLPQCGGGEARGEDRPGTILGVLLDGQDLRSEDTAAAAEEKQTRKRAFGRKRAEGRAGPRPWKRLSGTPVPPAPLSSGLFMVNGAALFACTPTHSSRRPPTTGPISSRRKMDDPDPRVPHDQMFQPRQHLEAGGLQVTFRRG
uniref:Uncharacterized protein n=1 Tax=Rangifer tarandus platyrhynchus TaxID=3082113 RepID=A0ACB0E6Q8_RANTA|nr:unnamed protein product [Rangifer tarandus platyrhynchus]